MKQTYSRARSAAGGRQNETKGTAKRGAVWVRKNDKAEFILEEKYAVGLRFMGYAGLFSLDHFEPKR